MTDASATVTSSRLDLRPVRAEDLDELHVLHADPEVWAHLPSGRHRTRERTAVDVEAYLADWARDEMGYWTARRLDDGAFVGIGGVRLRPTGVWNVYYRLSPAQQGQGFAVEIARAGLDAAARLKPSAPVTAILLEHNTASRRTAEKLGLSLAWRGPDAGNPNPEAVRLVYGDRVLDDEVLRRLVAR
ncbi:GNAT family N-acetyltransferase [Xylanimonas ulmi]|uniref:RimJ/RimL family protein N-acetyltransferase n=1 Tax=Xylanimonas ulmi TaxID=228973 RepID=A0A4Q7M736_9MICO|nr:GNAT family N-acetyltransferase [Xylanibacterium ulmi]RZS62462.1 RimJ/RimL family protein N-acetyltransferase [Xylanibacterium ulmi]